MVGEFPPAFGAGRPHHHQVRVAGAGRCQRLARRRHRHGRRSSGQTHPVAGALSHPQDRSRDHPAQHRLDAALAPADLAVLTEKTRLMTHKILFIESEQNIPLLTKLIKSYAISRFAIPASHIKITHRSHPPESKLLVQLINGHTSAVLHNLSYADLVRIKLAVKNDTALVSRILIVKTNVLTNEQQNLYDELSAYGIMLIEKPYPSIVEIIRFALGIN